MPSEAKSTRLHYAWVVAAVTFLVLLVAAGVRSVPGVLMVPLEKEFGWSRSTLSAAVSVNLMLYGLVGPFAAAIMGKLGIRKAVLTALGIVTVGASMTTLIHASWQLTALWGVVIGGGTGMIAIVLAAAVVNRWFATKRGVVLGVLTASTATGQLVFLPVLAAITERWGWRPAVLVVVAGLALAIPLVARFLRNAPADLGLRPYGADEEEPVQAPAPQVNLVAQALGGLREGVRSRDFWLLAGSFFVCGASTNGLIGTHLIPACADQGIPEVKAAGLLALMGIFDLLGTTASGWLSDRYDNRALLCWYYALRGLALIYLPFGMTGGSWGLMLFAVFYGLDWIATVPPTVRLTADAFGKERAGIMFGWIMAAHQLGAATAAFGAGTISSWTGSYERAFLTSGALCLATAALVLQIRKPGSAVRTEKPEAVPVEADWQAEPVA